MTKMPLEVNGVDWSSYIATYGYAETPRKVEGQNGGVMLDGTTRWDILAIKYDLVVPLMPLTMDAISIMLTSCVSGSVPVRYKSASSNSMVTRQMRPDFSAITLALKSPIQEYFSGMYVTFTEA